MEIGILDGWVQPLECVLLGDGCELRRNSLFEQQTYVRKMKRNEDTEG